MNAVTSFTIEQLSQASGVEVRTIRSYITVGLLERPDSRGAYARYDALQLDRLKAIRHLRETENLRLPEIGERLKNISLDNIRQIAQAFDREHGDNHPASLPPQTPTGVMAQLQKLTMAGEYQSGAQPPPASRPKSSSDTQRLLKSLAALTQGTRVPHTEKSGESSYHIQITPKITLSFRGPMTDEERNQIDRIADHLRVIVASQRSHP